MPTSSMQKESSTASVSGARGGIGAETAAGVAAVAAQPIPESWPREFPGSSSSGTAALLLTNVTLDSLFFAFYYQPNTPFKAAAIGELHNRGWRYHTQHKVFSFPSCEGWSSGRMHRLMNLLLNTCMCKSLWVCIYSCGSSAWNSLRMRPNPMKREPSDTLTTILITIPTAT